MWASDRPPTSERGYGYRHRKTRRLLQRRMDAGEHFTCWRCQKPIDPKNWHLGHDDWDRTIVNGPECPTCNTEAAARKANTIAQANRDQKRHRDPNKATSATPRPTQTTPRETTTRTW
jgi:hypothetical protein